MNSTEVKIDEAGERLDAYLAKNYSGYSRNYFTNLIKQEKVTVNGTVTKPSYTVKSSDQVKIEFDEPKMQSKTIAPEEIPLNIIYEDKNVIVINKQPGLVVHPGSGVNEGTLVNALVNYFPKIQQAVFEKGKEISELRPGLVHRLDKNTSGVIIVAKNSRSMHSLARQIQNRTIKKVYMALCYGWPQNAEGFLVNHLGRDLKDRKKFTDVGKEKGREAISSYKVLEFLKTGEGDKASLIEFDIKTGRTHQIRVQSKILGNPILGDEIYGKKESFDLSKKMGIQRQMLHAKRLQITLPGDDKASIFEAPLPDDFLNAERNFFEID